MRLPRLATGANYRVCTATLSRPASSLELLALQLLSLRSFRRPVGTQLSGISIGLIRTVGAGFFSLPLLFILRPAHRENRIGACCLLYAYGNFAGFAILFTVGVQRTSGSHAALVMATLHLLIGLIG